jgi:hypothetical protein
MTYQIMFYGGLAAALLTLIITIYVYVKMNIRRVISDLTGIKWKSPFGKKFSSQAEEEEKRTTNEIRLKKQDQTTLLGDSMDETTLLADEPAFYFRKEIDVVVTHSTTKL